jgi:hypothetical protein
MRPEPDAVMAGRSGLSHAEAVRASAFLSARYRKMWSAMADFQLDVDKIIRGLQKKKVPFVVTGAHGIGGWMGRPRATHDLDIIVRAGRNHARAVKAIKEMYPRLEVVQAGWLTAFFVPGEKLSVIDVTFPHRADQEITLSTGVWVEGRGLRYRVPTLEAALANKYGAMLSLTRERVKRVQDAVDFTTMVQHSLDEGQQPIDLAKLEELGEKVWPGGGGKEILKFVAQAKAGDVPDVTRAAKSP